MRNLTSDPLRNFKFLVTIVPLGNGILDSGLSKLGFMSVSGFGIQNEVIAYREGGDNTTTRKMPGQTDFGPITLARGMMSSPVTPIANGPGVGTGEVYDWLRAVFSVNEGSGTAPPGANFRADVLVDLLEHPITLGQQAAGINGGNAQAPLIRARFHIYNAWPMQMNWSDLDAGANAVVIESLQLAHEGFAVTYAQTDPGTFVSTSA